MKRQDTSFACAALVALALGSAGCTSAPAAREEHSTQAITSGAQDDGDRAAVWIVGKAKGQEGFCSGVVVAPHVVLTAAHCVSVNAEYSIFLGDDYNDASAQARADNYVAAVEHHTHPDWDSKRNLNDIGILITENAIPREPAQINRTKLTSGDVGKTVRIVGFGQTSADDKTIGRRHSAETAIKAIDATALAITGTPNICLYDSGGPTLMKRGDTDLVVGIHFLSDKATCDGQGVDTRVDPYVEFIDGYIKASTPPSDGGTRETDAGAIADSDANADVVSSPPAESSSCSLIPGRPPSRLNAVALLGAALTLCLIRTARRASRDSRARGRG